MRPFVAYLRSAGFRDMQARQLARDAMKRKNSSLLDDTSLVTWVFDGAEADAMNAAMHLEKDRGVKCTLINGDGSIVYYSKNIMCVEY